MAGNPNSNNDSYVLDVRPNDVLFGRGSGPNDHEGNIKFRELVAGRKEEYMATNHRQTKAKIAKDIVDRVFAVNGRFLKKLEGKEVANLGYGQGQDIYQIVDDDTIMEKAKQALRQNRNREDGGVGSTSPKPPHVTMASASPIFHQTLQQYGNDAAAAVGGYSIQEPFMQQHQQQQHNHNNPMSIPSSGGNMYRQHQQHQHHQHHHQQLLQQPQKPIYSLDNDGYATYTKTLDDPEDQRYFYTNSAAAAAAANRGRPYNNNNNNNNNNYGMAATAAPAPPPMAPVEQPSSMTGRSAMMMQSTGNSRRGSALLGGRKADALGGGGGMGAGGMARESLKFDDVWRRDSMTTGGFQGQSMQMSELMESFKAMSTTGELASTDTIGTIDNFGSLAGAAGTSAYNMSGMSNMSTMSMGSTLSLFKTGPDTPSSDGKSGGGSSSSGMERLPDDYPAAPNVGGGSAATMTTPQQLATETSTGDATLGGSDLWNSKQINSLMQGSLDGSPDLGGGGGASRKSKQINNLMQAPIDSSSNLNISNSLFEEKSQLSQQAYPGQILPSGLKKGPP